jgi:signal transduction histidine kinase
MPEPGFVRSFARAVGHDLRSPLNKVAAFAEALHEDLGPRLEGADAKLLGYLVESAGEAQAKLERLSQWGRLELRVDAAPVELDACVETALAGDSDLLRTPWPVVSGCAEQLTLLVTELVANARSFGDAPFRLTREEGVLGVLDAGPGVPAEFCDRAFHPLQRLESPPSCPGAGLGLSIAARIVELHGGDIWLEAGPVGGAHVRFTLGAPRP